jgi:hypothetical protein
VRLLVGTFQPHSSKRADLRASLRGKTIKEDPHKDHRQRRDFRKCIEFCIIEVLSDIAYVWIK